VDRACSCDFCAAIPPIKPCVARDLIARVQDLENAILDLLNAQTDVDCLKCVHVFRILMEHP